MGRNGGSHKCCGASSTAGRSPSGEVAPRRKGERAKWLLLAVHACGVAASLQVLVGQYLQLSSGDSGGSGAGVTAASLAAGFGLSLLGTVLLSVNMVLVQATSHMLTSEQVLAGVWVQGVTIPAVLSLIIGNDWTWVTSLDAYGWGVLLFAAIVTLGMGCSMVQVSAQVVGANAVSAAISLRLVAAILGQLVVAPYVRLTNPLAIAGVVLIIVVVSGFFALQVHLSRQQAAAPPAAQAQQQPVAAAPACDAGHKV
jgi:hypothetical protein